MRNHITVTLLRLRSTDRTEENYNKNTLKQNSSQNNNYLKVVVCETLKVNSFTRQWLEPNKTKQRACKGLQNPRHNGLNDVRVTQLDVTQAEADAGSARHQ